jgi:hypothetical protein
MVDAVSGVVPFQELGRAEKRRFVELPPDELNANRQPGRVATERDADGGKPG